MLTYKSADVNFYINAFNKGLIFSKNDVTNYLEHLKITPKSEFYAPCSHLAIIQRMLRNLGQSFEKIGEQDKLAEIQSLISLLED